MPELPEVQTVVSELNQKLKNKKITKVEVKTSKLVSVGPKTLSPTRTIAPVMVAKFKSEITGQKILSVKRRAKLLIFDLSGPYSLLAHLKMTGQFIYEDKKLRDRTKGMYRLFNNLTSPKELLPSKHTHIIFTFSDGSVLYFNDIRKFGYVKLVHDSEIGQVKELAEFGPEPLGKDFKLSGFVSAIKRLGKSSIKQALTNPNLVAGIGNIYSDEILFKAKVRPERKVVSIKNQELRAVYNAIRPVLRTGIKYKGSSVGDYVRTDGSWGTMGKHHFVYGRYKEQCKICETNLKRVKLGGRTSTFCPKCQE